MSSRSRLAAVIIALSGASVAACSSGAAPAANAVAPRTYRMGFSATPPRLTLQSVLATIEAWRAHADVALIAPTVPWRALLADTAAAVLVRRDQQQLVALYRSRGLPLIVEIDATDGLARDREAPELVALGRSIAEPAVQAVYREYLLAIDSILRPDYLGLAMETNLVRANAPPNVYDGLRTMVGSGAAALAANHSTAKKFVSVQVETAWGRLPAVGHFVGVETDRADFPFVDALGLSSYPFLAGFAEPEDVPLDYYARLRTAGAGGLPLLVTEGGWSSAPVTGVTSSPERQARWIRRQLALSDSGRLTAITQIAFADLDLASYGMPPESILPLFARLGLVDTSLAPKPALAEWDRGMARPLRPADPR